MKIIVESHEKKHFLKETIVKIQNLPDSKLQEVNDFTDFYCVKPKTKSSLKEFKNLHLILRHLNI